MSNLNVAIIDYQLSNLFSVKHACEFVKLNVRITNNPQDIRSADAIILPGVGAFGDAMENLQNLDLINPILEHIENQKPFMGICLGLQLLFESSEEFGNHIGLGVIKGKVVKFPATNSKGKQVRIPQIGWNRIEIQKKDPHLEGISNEEFMYFVHSFMVVPEESDVALTKTVYEEVEYISGVSKNNIFAVQFHPEKSGPEGLKIYENFSKMLKHSKKT